MRAQLGQNCRLSHSIQACTFAWVILLSSVGVGRRAAAAPSVAAAPATVEIGLVGKVSDDRTLPRRITSWFDGRKFRVTTRSMSHLDSSQILIPRQKGTVYVWVTLPKTSNTRIYFATTRRSGRDPVYLIRDLQLPRGLDEMGSERIAQVLHLSTLAILEGQAETRREEVERTLKADFAPDATHAQTTLYASKVNGNPANTQSPNSPENSNALADPRGVDIGVGYGIGFHADEGIWHGPRASLEYFLSRSFAIGGLIRTAIPHSQDVEGITLSVGAVSLGAIGCWHALVTQGVCAEVYAGPGLDVVYHRPTEARNPDATLAQGDTEARPTAIVGVGIVVGRTFPRVAFTTDATMLLSGTGYDLVDGRSRHARARAPVISPSIGLELRF